MVKDEFEANRSLSAPEEHIEVSGRFAMRGMVKVVICSLRLLHQVVIFR